MTKRLLPFILGVLAIVASSLPGKAYTVDQILENSNYYIGIYKYANWFSLEFDTYLSPNVSEGVTLSKVDDQHIRFSGIGGSLDFVFDLVDNNGNLTTDGTILSISGSTRAEANTKKFNTSMWTLTPCLMYCRIGGDYNFQQNYRPNDQTHLELIIKKDQKGKLYFEEGLERNYGWQTGYTTWGTILTAPSQNYNNYCSAVMDNMTFVPFTGNGFAIDTRSEYMDETQPLAGGDVVSSTATSDGIKYNHTLYRSASTDRTYPVEVRLDYANKRFAIINLGNNGYGINSNESYIQYGYYEMISFLGDTIPVQGDFDPETGLLTFDKSQACHWMLRQVYDDETLYGYTHDWFNHYLMTFDIENMGSKDELKGQYNPHGVRHNEWEHGWVSDGGIRRTYEAAEITIGDYTYVHDVLTLFQPNFDCGYTNTRMYVGPDVTHQAEIDFKHLGIDGENGIFVLGNYYPTENPQYVDHYDLYLTQEDVKNVAGRTDLCATHGFTHGLNISAEEYDFHHSGLEDEYPSDNARAVDGKSYFFSKLIPVKDIPNFDPKKPVTLYLKAHYKPGVNAGNAYTEDLTPTFHALTTKSTATTSVNDLIYDLPAVVTVDGSDICIAGNDTYAEIYDTTGRRMYSGSDTRVTMAPGIYIVRTHHASPVRVLIK